MLPRHYCALRRPDGGKTNFEFFHDLQIDQGLFFIERALRLLNYVNNELQLINSFMNKLIICFQLITLIMGEDLRKLYLSFSRKM